MSLTHLEDDYDHFYSPRFEVQLGGRTIREADGLISGLQVRTALDKTNEFSFTLNESYDYEHGTFVDFTDQPVVKGMPVVIKMGYGDTLRSLLLGIVESVEPDFPASGPPTISVSGNDLAHAMTKTTKSRSWNKMPLGAIVADVVSGYPFSGVSVDLPPTVNLTIDSLFQHELSDYAFLDRRIARRYGFEFFVRDGVFHFRKPDPLAEPVVSLTYGESLQSFSPSQQDSEVTVGQVKVRGWNAGSKNAITATAPVPGGGDDTDVRRAPVESQAEAQRIAQALAYDRSSGVTGQCETIGLPELREGEVVALEGLGTEFSGIYYIEETTHRFDNAGYTTSFTAQDASNFEVLG